METATKISPSHPESDVSTTEDALRAGVYALLGRLLTAPPDTDLLRRLCGLPAETGGGDELAAAWGALGLAAGRTSPEEAAEEYQDLFIGLGRGELVPYGSWYLTGFLMEKPLAQLRRDLARLGFNRREGVNEPEDHAGALCEVMSMLIGDGGPASAALQQAFFEAHMGGWMGRFFIDLQGAKTGRFYRAVGQLGEAFIEVEQQYYAMPV